MSDPLVGAIVAGLLVVGIPLAFYVFMRWTGNSSDSSGGGGDVG